MSFDTMKLSELKQVAQGFGVDLGDAKTKAAVLDVLGEEGVTWQMFEEFSNAEKEEVDTSDDEVPAVKPAKPVKAEGQILVKMERKNFTYQTFGYTFTAEHPFMAMPESTAQNIFDSEEGFRLATPREVQEFYS